MPLCKIWTYKYYKNVTNMIDIVISDCYTVKSLKNIFCKMKKKQKDMQMFRRHYEIQIYQSNMSWSSRITSYFHCSDQ